MKPAYWCVAALVGFGLGLTVPTFKSAIVDPPVAKPKVSLKHLAVSGASPATVTNANTGQAVELTTLKQELAALRQEVASLRQQGPRQRVPTDVSVASKPGREQSASSEQAEIDAEAKLFTKQGQVLEDTFRQQTVDQKWAKDTESVVLAGLAKDQIKQAALLGLECRQQTCRMVLANGRHQQPPDLIKFASHTADVLPNVVVSQTESDEEATVYYLSSEEFQLPQTLD